MWQKTDLITLEAVTMSKRYIKLQNQGNIYQNLMLLYEMANSNGYADENGYFTKRAIAEIAVNATIVTSAGKAGDDIIELVNNTTIDEGRNSVLQNAKARMQLLRVLGLVSTDYDSELYAITDLGEKVLSRVFPDGQGEIPNYALLRESFMGISSTSEVYDYYCDLNFNCYLGYEICYALANLDYKLGVQEMPLITTYSLEEIDDFVSVVRDYRSLGQKIPKTHSHYPKTQSGSPLKQASNLTRSINQILRICGIIERKDQKINGIGYYVCTDGGKKYVDGIRASMKNLKFWTPQLFRKEKLISQKEIANLGYGNMLDRGGYSVGIHDDKTVFSPYQMIPEINVNWLLESELRKPPTTKINTMQVVSSNTTLSELRLKPQYLTQKNYEDFIKKHISKTNIIKEIIDAKTFGKTKDDLEEELLLRHKNSDKEQFYPFVHSLLQAIGLDCRGEVGRVDAWIEYDGHIVPMEIKSHTETPAYNMKGMRQALENKICSYRKLSDVLYASLVIGYEHPSALLEIQEFIDAAYSQWEIKLITLDLLSLIKMCVNTVWDKQKINFEVMLQSYGIMGV